MVYPALFFRGAKDLLPPNPHNLWTVRPRQRGRSCGPSPCAAAAWSIRRSTRRDLTSSGSKKRRPPSPVHDLFKLRSPTSVFACDREDFLADHKDALSRLSRPAPKQQRGRIQTPPGPNLGRDARQLLLWAVKYTRKHFNDKLRE